MSPANIEATLKARSPLIGQACVIGDAPALQHGADRARPRLRAGLGRGARASRPRELDELAGDERIRAAVAGRASTRANAKLARVEQIKRFDLVPGDWLPGGDELTPTMKLKRKPIAAKYAAEIDALVLALSG